MTYAPASRASWVALEPTTPAAPCTRTLRPVRRRPCSNSPCHAVRPGITRAAPTVKSTSPGSGIRLRVSTATYSASVPSRYQSVHDSKDLLREISTRTTNVGKTTFSGNVLVLVNSDCLLLTDTRRILITQKAKASTMPRAQDLSG